MAHVSPDPALHTASTHWRQSLMWLFKCVFLGQSEYEYDIVRCARTNQANVVR